MNSWIFIVLSGLIEIGWAYTLKLSEMYTKPIYAGINIILMIVSLYFLTTALKEIPLGTAYAVWVAIGSLGVALLGIMILGESKSIIRIIFLLIVIFGVIGLKFTTT